MKVQVRPVALLASAFVGTTASTQHAADTTILHRLTCRHPGLLLRILRILAVRRGGYVQVALRVASEESP